MHSLLTIEAIRENPWNVMSHTLPTNPTEVLLRLACLAADYCRQSECLLMHAARAGEYVPAWWSPDAGLPDVHEESEDRGSKADQKLQLLEAFYAKLCGTLEES